MRGRTAATGRATRHSVVVAGASLSLLLIPVAAAAAAEPPLLTPQSNQSPNQAGPSHRHGVPTLTAPTLALPTLTVPSLTVPTMTVPSLTVPSLTVPSLRIPSSLDLGGLLHFGPGSATSTSLTSSAPTSGGDTSSPTSQPTATPRTRPATAGAALPLGGGQQPGGYPAATQSPLRGTTSGQATTDAGGSGSLALLKRLIGNGGVLMIAALLAATALAVIALARLGGFRREGRATRQH